MIKCIKRIIKWYFKQSSKTYAWTPTCTIPYIKEKEKTV